MEEVIKPNPVTENISRGPMAYLRNLEKSEETGICFRDVAKNPSPTIPETANLFALLNDDVTNDCT